MNFNHIISLSAKYPSKDPNTLHSSLTLKMTSIQEVISNSCEYLYRQITSNLYVATYSSTFTYNC